MSSSLWQKLPEGFLAKKKRAWDRLDYDLKLLVVELAEGQKFKCVFCTADRGLIIEHDHDPYEGDGERPTVNNIRGLVCQRCNWHLMMYEKVESGEHISWGNDFDCFISSRDYEDYKETYERRYLSLCESRLEKTCPNYLDRWMFLQKFDDWMFEGEDYPWYWGFEEIKEKRHGRIRTPKQFINALNACTRFVADEYKKNPNYQPSRPGQ